MKILKRILALFIFLPLLGLAQQEFVIDMIERELREFKNVCHVSHMVSHTDINVSPIGLNREQIDSVLIDANQSNITLIEVTYCDDKLSDIICLNDSNHIYLVGENDYYECLFIYNKLSGDKSHNDFWYFLEEFSSFDKHDNIIKLKGLWNEMPNNEFYHVLNKIIRQNNPQFIEYKGKSYSKQLYEQLTK